MDAGSPWFVSWTEQRRRSAAFRLFCFHYAGSGASIFRHWSKRLSSEIELLAMQLPGRENRIDEPLLHSIEHVTAELAAALAPLLDKPFAFFGHSSGAVIGFALARLLRERGLPQPRLLIASAENAPQIRPSVLRHRLSDPEFVEVIRRCEGTPDALLRSAAMLELLLPRLRADAAVYETYRYELKAPLDYPIVVFYGVDDTLVDGLGLAGWKTQTRHGVRRYGFPGGHFFLHEAEAAVVDQVDRELAPFLGEQTGGEQIHAAVGNG
jgi:medium-chain acyl-[acyl-carrier-protein] hydrolase